MLGSPGSLRGGSLEAACVEPSEQRGEIVSKQADMLKQPTQSAEYVCAAEFVAHFKYGGNLKGVFIKLLLCGT